MPATTIQRNEKSIVYEFEFNMNMLARLFGYTHKNIKTYIVVDGCKGDGVVVVHSNDLVLEDLEGNNLRGASDRLDECKCLHTPHANHVVRRSRCNKNVVRVESHL